jgi:hypothetical protein
MAGGLGMTSIKCNMPRRRDITAARSRRVQREAGDACSKVTAAFTIFATGFTREVLRLPAHDFMPPKAVKGANFD